ncbi:MAG: polysaccharide deacetylase family protein [Candidatus Sumerlaeota bacterium]|nr:polysaccharide deacetylase family protein [Candidatus Sumerlaeota bacterium]
MPEPMPAALIFARPEDEFAPCADYVMRLFACTEGLTIRAMDSRVSFNKLPQAAPPRVVVLYDAAMNSYDAPLSAISALDMLIVIERGNYFGTAFMKSPSPPEPHKTMMDASERGAFQAMIRRDGPNVCRMDFDLIASAFWFLARCEEYVSTQRDEHDRFQCAFSAAQPQAYDQPLVNRWFINFMALIEESGRVCGPAPLRPNREKIRVALTHDVDLLRKYRGFAGARRAVTTIRSAGGLAKAARVSLRAGVALTTGRGDPYDSFNDLFFLKENLRAKSVFFFMGGGATKYDGKYDIAGRGAQALIRRALGQGDEIGAHPSYDSYRSERMICDEAGKIGGAAGAAIRVSRQHYLRFAVPETWRALAGCGLRCDCSMAFADRAGFRCGWSGCFRPFDVSRREEIPIIEIPMVAMDVSLAVYEKLPAEQVHERLSRLLDASRAPGGAFVLLWHNTMADRLAHPGYWDALANFFESEHENMEFVTISELCDEFEHREKQSCLLK